jgi:hypothetical protein
MWVSILYIYEILSIADSILLWLRTGRSVTLNDYDFLCKEMLYQHYPGENEEGQHKFGNELLFGLQKKKSFNTKYKIYRHYSFVSCVCFITVRLFNVPLHPLNSTQTYLYVHVSYFKNTEFKIYLDVQNIHLNFSLKSYMELWQSSR